MLRGDLLLVKEFLQDSVEFVGDGSASLWCQVVTSHVTSSVKV